MGGGGHQEITHIQGKKKKRLLCCDAGISFHLDDCVLETGRRCAHQTTGIVTLARNRSFMGLVVACLKRLVGMVVEVCLKNGDPCFRAPSRTLASP